MSTLSINTYENYLYHTYGHRTDIHGMSTMEQNLFMKLVEEMGEIAEVLNIRAGRKSGETGSTEELAAELADLIHYAVAIAAINHIDLSETILEKDKKASIKYGHKINLTDFMENA